MTPDIIFTTPFGYPGITVLSVGRVVGIEKHIRDSQITMSFEGIKKVYGVSSKK